MNIAAGREVHHRVSAIVDGGVQLLQFFVNVRSDRRVTDVGVDLAERGHADAHGVQFRMIDVGRNNHAAAGDFFTNQFRRDFFAVSDVSYFLSQDALAGIMHLREVAVLIFCVAAGDPLRTRPGNAVPVIVPVVAAAVAVCRIHLGTTLAC